MSFHFSPHKDSSPNCEYDVKPEDFINGNTAKDISLCKFFSSISQASSVLVLPFKLKGVYCEEAADILLIVHYPTTPKQSISHISVTSHGFYAPAMPQ